MEKITGLKYAYKAAVIPDLHLSPKEDPRRCKWIGRFINDVKPDAVIQIGDLLDLDSLCTHNPNGTLKGKQKPSYDDDLVCLAEGLDVMNKHMKWKPPVKHVTFGNHEHRAWRFEDANPEMQNLVINRLTDTVEHYGWTWTPYGAYFNFQGVDFTHRPLDHMGKPFGSKFAARSVAAEVHRDTVFGDTHKFYDFRTSKVGSGDQNLRVIEVGCAMEWGMVKDYAKHNKRGWWYGVVVLTIINGRIEGVDSVPMFKLEKDYNY